MDLYLVGVAIMFGYFGCMAYFVRRRAHIGPTKKIHFIFIALLATFLLITGQGRAESLKNSGPASHGRTLHSLDL
jgi:hypothetical protein